MSGFLAVYVFFFKKLTNFLVWVHLHQPCIWYTKTQNIVKKLFIRLVL